MSGREYVVLVMGLRCGLASKSFASELFAECPDTRTGTLKDGFAYWIAGEFIQRLVRVDVYPVKRPHPQKERHAEQATAAADAR